MYIMDYDDVSFNDYLDVSIMEDSSDVSGNDESVSDWWLNPLSVSGNDLSPMVETDYSEYLSTISDKLESIEKYCNLFFGVFFLFLAYYFVRKIVYRFNSHGKGID